MNTSEQLPGGADDEAKREFLRDVSSLANGVGGDLDFRYPRGSGCRGHPDRYPLYPTEVEDVLVRHPQVQEACVIGLPDERLGQTVTAFVVARRAADGTTMLSAAGLDCFCREAKGFASFERARHYEFVDALTKSPTGKLLRRLLGT